MRIGTASLIVMSVLWYYINFQPGEFIHSMGDTHVYLNHVKPLELQLERKPRPFPKLIITRRVTDINDFKFDDFLLEGYNPYPKISMEMAV